jgi:YHYH protein
MKNKIHSLMFVLLTVSLMAVACAPVPAPVQPRPQGSTQSVPASQTAGPPAAAGVASPTAANDAPHVDVLDVTHLALGDGKVSSSPQRGYVFSCMTRFNGHGAQGTGAWINGDGTWDLTKKPTVDGSVTWPNSFSITLDGGQRLFSSNDLPDHPSGDFPIGPGDDAYSLDRNPNSIQPQAIQFSVPAHPALAAQPTCVGGEVGILLSGVLIFSAFDAEGHDAPAHELQDECGGHPQEGGYYHYHDLSPCIPDHATGPSALLGYALDGFGIYGPYGADGRELTDADLDECHGLTSEVEWDGQPVVMYHYVATREFPYVVGCFRGTPSVRPLAAPGGGQQNGQPPGQPQGGQAGGGPPLEAINACANLARNAACSFNAPNGQAVGGTCQTPPGSTQLACVPAGGPPTGP